METKLKKHPIYISVAEDIAKDVQEQGYGVIYSTDVLISMLGLTALIALHSSSEHTNFAFKKMAAFEGLRKTLLEEYQLAIDNDQPHRYIIVDPESQRKIVATKYSRKASRAIRQCVNVLLNTRVAELSGIEQAKRLRALEKASFLSAQFGKRLGKGEL